MMAECPGFDVALARLMELRGQGISELSGQSIPEAELRAVLAGTPPEEEHLRRLAPALGISPAALSVVTGMDLPDPFRGAHRELPRWPG
jgi:hypothetical protein